MSMRFGPVTMMAATAAVILGFNTLSLHVSAERGKVEKLERRIAADMREIRALEAELRTRARLPVLQTWNDNVLAMSAPTAKQFADSPVQLAAFAPGAPTVGAPAVQMALATPETLTVPTPGLVKATYAVPSSRGLPIEVVVDLTDARGPVAKAALTKSSEPKGEVRKAGQTPAVSVKLAEAKSEAPRPAARGGDDSLGALIGAIDSAAAVERGGAKASMQ